MTGERLTGYEQPHPEQEISIDGKALVRIFQSETVRQSLRTILQRSHEANKLEYEAEQGIQLLLDPSTARSRPPTLVALSMEVAEYDSITFSPEGSEQMRELLEAGMYPIARFHTHPADEAPTTPYQSHIYAPSAGDLAALAITRQEGQEDAGYDGYPISGICMVEKRHLRMLLIQETAYAPRSDRVRELYEQDAMRASSYREILNALHSYGLKAAAITYEPGNRTPLTQEGKTALNAFAFTLKPFRG